MSIHTANSPRRVADLSDRFPNNFGRAYLTVLPGSSVKICKEFRTPFAARRVRWSWAGVRKASGTRVKLGTWRAANAMGISTGRLGWRRQAGASEEASVLVERSAPGALAA